MKLKWKVAKKQKQNNVLSCYLAMIVIIADVVVAAVTMHNFSHLNPTIHSL